MGILRAIVQLLGGLALFLYGIELMGDGLKNSSGAALKRVLEKVTGNVVMGVLTGALVTAVIQSSTATIVLTVALIGAGVLNLRRPCPSSWAPISAPPSRRRSSVSALFSPTEAGCCGCSTRIRWRLSP